MSFKSEEKSRWRYINPSPLNQLLKTVLIKHDCCSAVFNPTPEGRLKKSPNEKSPYEKSP